MSESSSNWVHRVYYDQDKLMKSWRRALVQLLRAALHAGQLQTTMTTDEIQKMLDKQERRWWRIKIQSFKSKGHFLQYAGRYVRRPPIAQRRITFAGQETVIFWYKDKKLRRRVKVQCSPEEFIDHWSQHIPERYRHAVRSFGLFAPRRLAQTSAATFAILGQVRRQRPKPRRSCSKRVFIQNSATASMGRRPETDQPRKFSRRLMLTVPPRPPH